MFPTFNNPQLLKIALTHRSALNEPRLHQIDSYERLEFLGDAVLELSTSEYLFNRFPNADEGTLTNYRSSLVKTETLSQIAQQLEVGPKIKMSKGEIKSKGRENKSILADAMEAIIGAIYLDQGYSAVSKFLATHLFPLLDKILAEKTFKDAKSSLQEIVQAKGFSSPTYKVVKAVGPDHSKVFTIEVEVDGQVIGQGVGASKQLAQQQAAQIALEKISNQ